MVSFSLCSQFIQEGKQYAYGFLSPCVPSLYRKGSNTLNGFFLPVFPVYTGREAIRLRVSFSLCSQFIQEGKQYAKWFLSPCVPSLYRKGSNTLNGFFLPVFPVYTGREAIRLRVSFSLCSQFIQEGKQYAKWFLSPCVPSLYRKGSNTLNGFFLPVFPVYTGREAIRLRVSFSLCSQFIQEGKQYVKWFLTVFPLYTGREGIY